MNSRWMGSVLVVVAAVLAIWTVAIPGVMQWQLESALHRSIPAESIKVGVRGRPEVIFNGEIPWLSLDVRGAVVDGLRIETFTAEISAVELESPRLFRGGPFVVRRVGGGRAMVTLTEEGLQRYLEEKGIRSARVHLTGGHLTLEGMIPVFQHEFQAAMQGRFVLVDERAVVLQVESLSVSGISLAPEIANVLITPLNPLLTVDHLPIPLRLRHVTIDRGRLTLTAEPSS